MFLNEADMQVKADNVIGKYVDVKSTRCLFVDVSASSSEWGSASKFEWVQAEFERMWMSLRECEPMGGRVSSNEYEWVQVNGQASDF